jgi:hypothetical protein
MFSPPAGPHGGPNNQIPWSSLPEDGKLPITELKWDARTVTDIAGNNAYWFFAFFWLTKGSRNKNYYSICEWLYVIICTIFTKNMKVL